MAENRPVLGITHDELALDILPRQIGSHVKFPRISRLSYSLSRAKKPDPVAELHSMTPARQKLYVTPARFAVDLN